MAVKKNETVDKNKALENAIKQITKDFGEGSIMKLGENAAMNIDVIPTGSINLDAALGLGGVPRGRIVEIYGAESSGKTTIALHIIAEAQKMGGVVAFIDAEALGLGGVPRGRIVEIYGAESSGKTTIALHIIAEAQKMGGVVAFIDAEHALDPTYAKALGVDIDEMLISQPDFGEQALEIADMLVRSGAVDVIVVDSVAALVPKAEIDGEMSDQQMGLQARLMSKALRKLTGTLNKSKTTLIFIRCNSC